MKKILCLTIAILMMAFLGAPAFAQTDDSATEASINDSLVTWWNFEGDTEEEALQDKATNSTSTDDLTKKGDATEISDGIAYVPSACGNSLQMTAANADLTNVSSMTIYMKAKYSGNNTDFADLFAYNGLYRIYKLNDSTSPDGAVFEASAFATKNNSSLGTVRIRPQTDGAVGIQQDEWFYLALTMEIGDDNTGKAVLYLSKDGLTYSKSETAMAFTADILADLETRRADTGAAVMLGKLNISDSVPDRGISYWFDDVRIYNKVLTESEITTIIPNSLELREVVDTTINGSLVTWWNFEGDTEEDALKDKATHGESTDDLTKNGTGTAIADGVAYVPSAVENNLQMSAATADLTGVSSMTIYMKAKYSGTNTDFADLFSYQGLYRIYKLKDSLSADGAVWEASAFATKNNSELGTVRIRPQSDGAVGIQPDEWFYLALTMEIDSDNKGTAILYVSKDGLTYSGYETTMDFTADILADLQIRQADTATTVALGKLISTSDVPTPDRGIDYWFDDVRIYNKVLTKTEIATIIPNTLELRDVSELPPEPSEPSDPSDPQDTGTSEHETDEPTVPGTVTDDSGAADVPTGTEPDSGTDTGAATEKKAGCASALGTGTAMLVALACAACALRKKKRGE